MGQDVELGRVARPCGICIREVSGFVGVKFQSN